jgi:hypothetical protein
MSFERTLLGKRMKVGSARVSAEQQNLCNWVDGKKRGHVVIRQLSALAAEAERLVETEANDIGSRSALSAASSIPLEIVPP